MILPPLGTWLEIVPFLPNLLPGGKCLNLATDAQRALKGSNFFPLKETLGKSQSLKGCPPQESFGFTLRNAKGSRWDILPAGACKNYGVKTGCRLTDTRGWVETGMGFL